MGRPFPSAEGTGFAARRATGCGDPHQRLSALRPPWALGGFAPLGWGHPQTAAGRTLPRSDETWLWSGDDWIASRSLSSGGPKAGPAGGMTAEDRSGGEHFGETNPRKEWRSFWRNEPEKERTAFWQNEPESSAQHFSAPAGMIAATHKESLEWILD